MLSQVVYFFKLFLFSCNLALDIFSITVWQHFYSFAVVLFKLRREAYETATGTKLLLQFKFMQPKVDGNKLLALR